MTRIRLSQALLKTEIHDALIKITELFDKLPSLTGFKLNISQIAGALVTFFDLKKLLAAQIEITIEEIQKFPDERILYITGREIPDTPFGKQPERECFYRTTLKR